jgi:rhodanese-related sulfurtransferase
MLLADKDVSSQNVTFAAPAGYPGGSAKFFLWDSNYVPITFNLPYEPAAETYYPEPFVQSYIGTLSAKAAVLSGAKLVDVRSAAEYAAGHIKWESGEAVNAPVTDMLNGIAAIVGSNKGAEIILYCDNAYRSLLAKRILDYAGYTKVSVLGSMDNWNLAVRILMTSSVPNRYANNPITIRYENVSVYDTGTYQLFYSLGPDSTVSDAVAYPTGGINLTGPNTVKAYLKYNGQVVAEAQTDYIPYIAETIPGSPANVIYASDMPASQWLANVSGWGTTRMDRSIDNAALRVNNVTYAKGIGTHATGYIELAIPEGATRFITVAGIDTEVGLTRGNLVQFFVYVDGVLIDKSLEISPNQYKVFNIDLTGYAGAGHVLRLVCDQGSDGMDYDHADWAIAAFVLV